MAVSGPEAAKQRGTKRKRCILRIHHVIHGCEKGTDGSPDDIDIHACAPVQHAALSAPDTDISDGSGGRALLQRVLLVGIQIILKPVCLLERAVS